MHRILEQDGFEPFLNEYMCYWLHSNQTVVFREDGMEKTVVLKGLTKSGYLLAQNVATGENLELHPDSNSLNFWEGFISRKIKL